MCMCVCTHVSLYDSALTTLYYSFKINEIFVKVRNISNNEAVHNDDLRPLGVRALSQVKTLRIPYACKLLFQELQVSE